MPGRARLSSLGIAPPFRPRTTPTRTIAGGMFEFFASAEHFAAGAVSAGGAETSGGQVADAGEAEERFAAGAHGGA